MKKQMLMMVAMFVMGGGASLAAGESEHGRVNATAFSQDGMLFLTGVNFAQLVDLNGRVLTKFKGHRGYVTSVAFSPDDGKYILTGSKDKIVRLWVAATGDEERQFTGLSLGVSSVAFSGDGKHVLAASSGDIALLWELATGKELMRFETSSIPNLKDAKGLSVFSAAFLPEGTEGKPIVVTRGSPGIHSSVTIKNKKASFKQGEYKKHSPEKRSAIRLWDLATGKEVGRFEGHKEPVVSVAFSRDGKLMLTGGDNSARLWEVDTGRMRQLFPSGWDLTPDHEDYLKMITQYDLSEAEKANREWLSEAEKATNKVGYVSTVTLAPDGKQVLTASNIAGLMEWDEPKNKVTQSDSRYMAQLWYSDGSLVKKLNHQDKVSSLTFSPDGTRFLTGSDDGIVRLWEAATGNLIKEFK